MKYILRILGGIFMIVAAINSSNYIMDYSTLPEYGKGYVWG